jgi:hypothetical protein
MVVRVVDDGPGVPPGKRAYLFSGEPRKAGLRGNGAGLGLGICQRLATSFRGQVWHDPQPTGGSIFCVSVPVGSPVLHLASFLRPFQFAKMSGLSSRVIPRFAVSSAKTIHPLTQPLHTRIYTHRAALFTYGLSGGEAAAPDSAAARLMSPSQPPTLSFSHTWPHTHAHAHVYTHTHTRTHTHTHTHTHTRTQVSRSTRPRARTARRSCFVRCARLGPTFSANPFPNLQFSKNEPFLIPTFSANPFPNLQFSKNEPFLIPTFSVNPFPNLQFSKNLGSCSLEATGFCQRFDICSLFFLYFLMVHILTVQQWKRSNSS